MTIKYTGVDKMLCNLCSISDFADMGKRKKVRCQRCNSLERTRVIGLFLQKNNYLEKGHSVLHIAPEKGLANYMVEIAGEKITFADLNPENYSFLSNVQKLDLCKDLESFQENSFDLIIHNHVLEHVPCNYAYVMYQFHRLLKPSGRMLFSLPIMDGYYQSSNDPHMKKKERIASFGQDDHIRSFGVNDLQMSLGKIYKLDSSYDLTKTFEAEVLEKYNIPKEAWYGYTSHSVFNVGKYDFKIGKL